MTQDDAHAPAEPTPADSGQAPAPVHAHEAGEQAHFSPQEWQEFREADKTAGAYIVVLMQGIFTVGLVLYLIVLWSVS